MPLTIIHETKRPRCGCWRGPWKRLFRANIEVDPEDEVYPVRDSYVSAGMSINVIEVETKTITEQETLYYKELTKNDSTLAKGRPSCRPPGKTACRRITIEITYKNGVEISRKTVSEKVISEPVDQVTLVGTYEAPKATQSPAPASLLPPRSPAHPTAASRRIPQTTTAS